MSGPISRIHPINPLRISADPDRVTNEKISIASDGGDAAMLASCLVYVCCESSRSLRLSG